MAVKSPRITESELEALHEAFEQLEDPRLGTLLDRLCDDPSCDAHDGDDEQDDDDGLGPATLLHLSDLHLGENLDDVGRPDYGTLGSALEAGATIMQSHDSFILAALPNELQMAARSMGSQHDDFDFNVVREASIATMK